MVLVSFEKQFIYTKTEKSAGTSVEVFFQPYCVPPEFSRVLRMPAEMITDYGIVGARGAGGPQENLWYNHMPASEVRRCLGDEIWQEFFKFCVVRNPFDKLVSGYFFSLSEEQRTHIRTQDFTEIRRGFLTALTAINQRLLGADRNSYVIDGAICIDFFIRYERLREDVTEVCRRLDIRRDVGEMQRLKSKFRITDVHFSEFYDRDAEAIVAQACAFELDYFGYRLRG